jgi:hypothetical protein
MPIVLMLPRGCARSALWAPCWHLLGVPEPLLPAVRALSTDNDLDGPARYLPPEAADALFLLAAGFGDRYWPMRQVRCGWRRGGRSARGSAPATKPKTSRR